VLAHLKSVGKEYRLHFIVFTHPHKDHFSGTLQLLNYLESENIPVAFFCHTYYYHLKFRDKIPAEKYVFITKFREIVNRLEKRNLFAESIQIGSRTVLPLTASGLQLRCLSPSNQELNIYQDKILAAADKDAKKSSEDANLLSTVIKIEMGDGYLLFTSDAHTSSFERLHKNMFESGSNKEITLGQVPHHGSPKNYHEPFWHALKRKPETTAVISVGDNDYNHPSAKVLQSLHTAGYRVHCTNIVNEAVAFYNQIDPEIQALLTALDDDSVVVNEKRHFSFEMPFK
jgi:hypothetical protein